MTEIIDKNINNVNLFIIVRIFINYVLLDDCRKVIIDQSLSFVEGGVI